MSLLIRLYPRPWRERYGDELAALLEDRPPGPSDVLDLVLGAFDAHLHRRGRGSTGATGSTAPWSVRLGSVAAVAGGVLWMLAVVVAVYGRMDDSNPPMALVAVAMLSILIALAALSAAQSRRHPVLVWASFLLPAIGIVLLATGAVAQLVVGDRPIIGQVTPWVPWFFGIMLALVGCAIFGIVSAVTGGLTPWTAVMLSVASVTQLATLFGHDVRTDGDVMLGGAAVFGVSWLLVGVGVARSGRTPVDRPV